MVSSSKSPRSFRDILHHDLSRTVIHMELIMELSASSSESSSWTESDRWCANSQSDPLQEWPPNFRDPHPLPLHCRLACISGESGLFHSGDATAESCQGVYSRLRCILQGSVRPIPLVPIAACSFRVCLLPLTQEWFPQYPHRKKHLWTPPCRSPTAFWTVCF